MENKPTPAGNSMMEKLTVKELKQIIADLPDELEVTLNTHSIKLAKRKVVTINGEPRDMLILNDDLDYCF